MTVANDNITDKDIIKSQISSKKILEKINKNLRNILFIEDDKLQITLINNIINKTKYSIYNIRDGLEAYEYIFLGKKIKDIKIDISFISLIILDLNLPNLNGMKILESMKDRSIDIPIIMWTADDYYRTVMNCVKKNDNVVDFFSKSDIRENTFEEMISSIDNQIKLFNNRKG